MTTTLREKNKLEFVNDSLSQPIPNYAHTI